MLYVDNQPGYLTPYAPPVKAITFDVLARSDVEHTDDSDICDPTRQVLLVQIGEAEGNLTASDVKKLIERGVSPVRCYCEHDCCGHRHGHADVRLFDFDRAEVTVFTSRNY